MGLSTFTLDTRRSLGEIPSGKRVIVQGSLKNASSTKQTFALAQIVLHGQVQAAR